MEKVCLRSLPAKHMFTAMRVGARVGGFLADVFLYIVTAS